MNIVFFGSSQFAIASLEALIKAGHKISCVVTQPDHQKGRHLHYEGTAIKTDAARLGLEVYQPACINCCTGYLNSLKADIFVVISYGQILSSNILQIPARFCLNVHASLLPKYRGAAPINWALINGEETTGLSLIKMSQRMDAGEIILQKPVKIDRQDTVVTLRQKLADAAPHALLEALEMIQQQRYQLMPQDESAVSFAPKLLKSDGLINWRKSSREISNLIRGVLGWPGAYTYYKGKLLKIYKAETFEQNDGTSLSLLINAAARPQGPAGEIAAVVKDGIVVSTGDGNLVLRQLQIEGKRVMTAREFITGHRMKSGELLTDKK